MNTTDGSVEIIASAESPYFVIRTVRKAAETCTATVKDCHEKYLQKRLDSGKDFIEAGVKKITGLTDKTVETIQGVKKDAVDAAEKAIESGQDFFKKLPCYQKLEDKVKSGLGNISHLINLPNKNDIDRLNAAVEVLNSKVDALNKKHVG
ncbi:MAG: hypothetical protein HQK57_11865 [Deltaproteobacteria bacterium]|nr:hypothetical protein [Deltaproteobacteria bacterium]